MITTPIGMGHFAEIDTNVKTDINPGTATTFWRARIKTKRSSDLYVLENTIPPGKTFGWHSHPGPSLVIVKSGTATLYLAADPTCAPHVVPAGSGFIDQGHDVHVVRNEGSVGLVTVVVSLVPEGFARRIDEPSPGCLPRANLRPEGGHGPVGVLDHLPPYVQPKAQLAVGVRRRRRVGRVPALRRLQTARTSGSTCPWRDASEHCCRACEGHVEETASPGGVGIE